MRWYDKPKLFWNHSLEDKKAMKYLIDNDVDFDQVVVGGTRTPYIRYKSSKYEGFSGVKYFVDVIIKEEKEKKNGNIS